MKHKLNFRSEQNLTQIAAFSAAARRLPDNTTITDILAKRVHATENEILFLRHWADCNPTSRVAPILRSRADFLHDCLIESLADWSR